MLKVNLGGCSSFVNDAEYKTYVEKAFAAFDVLENETGAGNDFLGWKHLPSQTLAGTLVDECEAVRDAWAAKNVDLVIVIGIGGSYLGSKCAIEALSHQFAKQLKTKSEAPEIVFAGQNLSEEYMCELMDLVQERNAACVVISKSGTTTEPAVAFRLVKKYLEDTYGKAEAAERIVAVTDKARGALKSLSTQEGYKTFVIEDNVGGRFSVLTPVGLLPIVLAGYDVRDYKKVAERYGTEEDVIRLFNTAHEKGIKVLLDLVPGHTSDTHEWFQQAKKAEKSDVTNRYIFTDCVWEAPPQYRLMCGICERDGNYLVNYFSSQPAINAGCGIYSIISTLSLFL